MMVPVTQPCGWGIENGISMFKHINSVYLMILGATFEAKANSTQNNQREDKDSALLVLSKWKKTFCWDPREYFFLSLSFSRLFIDSQIIQGCLIFSTCSLFISFCYQIFPFLISPLIFKSCKCLIGKLWITSSLEAILFCVSFMFYTSDAFYF